MSNEEKERRCKLCGRHLIDEKIPFCSRCFLEGRNKVGKFGSAIGVGVLVVRGKSLINNSSGKKGKA